MSEKVSHGPNMSSNSSPFGLLGNFYTVSLTAGTLAVGADPVSLQVQAGPGFIDVDPPVRFTSSDVGSSRAARLAAGTYRWKVPLGGHSVSTAINGL